MAAGDAAARGTGGQQRRRSDGKWKSTASAEVRVHLCSQKASVFTQTSWHETPGLSALAQPRTQARRERGPGERAAGGAGFLSDSLGPSPFLPDNGRALLLRVEGRGEAGAGDTEGALEREPGGHEAGAAVGSFVGAVHRPRGAHPPWKPHLESLSFQGGRAGGRTPPGDEKVDPAPGTRPGQGRRGSGTISPQTRGQGVPGGPRLSHRPLPSQNLSGSFWKQRTR